MALCRCMGSTPGHPQLGVKQPCVQAANGFRGVIDFNEKYRQYFTLPRHVMIYDLSEAVESNPGSEARHLKGKLVFRVR